MAVFFILWAYREKVPNFSFNFAINFAVNFAVSFNLTSYLPKVQDIPVSFSVLPPPHRLYLSVCKYAYVHGTEYCTAIPAVLCLISH